MEQDLLPSLEAMIAPEALTRILGVPIREVVRAPLSAGFAHSGSGLEYLTTTLGDGAPASPPGPRLVLKRIALEWDWLMRATADDRCRSVTLWTRGILDDLPPLCHRPVLACCRDGSGWAILMQDHSESIMTNRPFTAEVNELLLSLMAAMHAAFLEDPRVIDPETGLCRPVQVYRMFSPQVARQELARESSTAELPHRIREGWDLAREVMPRSIMETIDPLLEDPTPLCSALEAFPPTLVHGDFRHSNLGVSPEPPPGRESGSARVALLDWQLAAAAPPAVELGRYLGANSSLLPAGKEECLRFYRAALEKELQGRSSLPSWWQPHLELGLLGGFLQDGWALVLKATRWSVGAEHREHWKGELAWWAEQVRRGERHLNR